MNACENSSDKRTGLNVNASNLFDDTCTVNGQKADRAAFASVGYMLCPTRSRSNISGTGNTPGGTANFVDNGSNLRGPCTDYAVLVYVRQNTIPAGKTTAASSVDAESTEWWQFIRKKNYQNNDRFRSPWRWSSTSDGTDGQDTAKKWIPSNDFSYWQDGTSNQIVIGEKHIPYSQLQKWVYRNKVSSPDGSYMFVEEWEPHFHSFSRVLSKYKDSAVPILASGPKDRDDGSKVPQDHYGFGSYHTGICNFLIGDGSVHAFPITTGDDVLFMLSDVSDGGTVSLP
jgi:hypothetical protein